MKIDRLTVAFVLVLLFAYSIWWIPGVRIANDYPLVSENVLKSFLDVPRTWTERGAVGLGEYTVFTLWSWPLNFLSAIFANVGMDFSLQERIYLVLFVIAGGIYGVFKLGSEVGLRLPGKLAASLFLLMNTYILLLIDGGQLNIAYAYSTIPLVFFYLLKAVNSSTVKPKIIFSLLVTLVGIFDIRFIFIFILLASIYSIYQLLLSQLLRKKLIINILNTFLITAVIFALLNCYWIVPLFMNPLEKGVYQQLTQISPSGFINTGHAFLLLSPHWYQNIFGKVSALKSEFGLFLILVFLAPILKRKNLWIGFWLVVSIISIFLSKGTSEPFGQVYIWLYSYLPGFSLFRDSSKFLSLVALSYSFLIGTTFEYIYTKLRNRLWTRRIFVISFLASILILVNPIWLGRMNGTFSQKNESRTFSKASEMLSGNKSFSRTFWIPATQPLSYSDTNHPIVEAARLYNIKPFVYGVKGSYETFNFLREAPFAGELFDVLGISHLIYPPPEYIKDNTDLKYYHTFLGQLSNLPWVNSQNEILPILTTKTHQDRFFITPNTWGLLGMVGELNEATKSYSLRLSNNSFIFAEDKPNQGLILEKIDDIKIILKNKTIDDLAATFIPSQDLLFPSRLLDDSPNGWGWWKRESSELLNWRDFLKSKYDIEYQDFDYSGGWAVGEGNLKLKVKSEKLKSDQILLARVMEGSRSGSLKFTQNNQNFGTIYLNKEQTNMRWLKIGKLNSNQPIEIESSGEINVLNVLAIVNASDWENYLTKAQKLFVRSRDYDEKNIDYNLTDVDYEKISPTKYKIKINNLRKSSILVFSATYNQGWEIAGKKSIPVYGLLNGFWTDHNGEYTVEFMPQRYVMPSLMVSALTLVIVLLMLIYIKWRY